LSTLVLDRVDGGIDLRKGEASSDANRLREADNVYITKGYKQLADYSLMQEH